LELSTAACMLLGHYKESEANIDGKM
jgi:hypothetical protein